jgi:hypothetical protein
MSRPLHEFLLGHGDPQQHADLLRLTKGWSFVNCWHMNESESAAMWKIYSSAIHRVAQAGPAVASGQEYQPAPEATIWKHVDLGGLAENIFVSPAAKPWFLELVTKVLVRYGLNAPVRQSDLAAEPLF